jgi:hypothetical protein
MMNRPGRPTIDPAGLGETPSRANLLVGVSLGLKKTPVIPTANAPYCLPCGLVQFRSRVEALSESVGIHPWT